MKTNSKTLFVQVLIFLYNYNFFGKKALIWGVKHKGGGHLNEAKIGTQV